MTASRRALLLIAGSAAVGAAGCLANDDGDGTPELDRPGADSDATEDGSTPAEANALSAQVSLSTPAYAVSAVPATELRYVTNDANEPRPLSAFPGSLADALEQAHDEGYSTGSVDDPLLAAIDEERERPYQKVSRVCSG